MSLKCVWLKIIFVHFCFLISLTLILALSGNEVYIPALQLMKSSLLLFLCFPSIILPPSLPVLLPLSFHVPTGEASSLCTIVDDTYATILSIT